MKNTKQPDNHELRLQYWETLKLYRKTLRAKEEQHEQHQLEETEESIDSNHFWKKWHSFNKSNKEELAIQKGEIWKIYTVQSHWIQPKIICSTN